MQNHTPNLLSRAAARAHNLSRFLFSRRQLRTTAIAAVLASFAPLASAVDMSDLGSATGIVCLVSAYVSGPWLYAIGVVLVIVGAVAIANSESNIGKFISTGVIGLGLASVAVPIVKNHLGVAYTCA